jgi:hypothetical protein
VGHCEGIKGLSRHKRADEPGPFIPRPLDPLFVSETPVQMPGVVTVRWPGHLPPGGRNMDPTLSLILLIVLIVAIKS